MANWYDQIEESVRPLVHLLRDNGFNTVCSCGHENTVQLEWYGVEEDMHRLYNLLTENKYRDFELLAYWSSDNVSRFIEIRLYPIKLQTCRCIG